MTEMLTEPLQTTLLDHDILRAVLALLFVLGLLVILSRLVQKAAVVDNKRLKLVESLALGDKHRMVLVRRDDVEHLILLGADGGQPLELSIETVALGSEESA